MVRMARKDLPIGTVTFLFTDVEGSTRWVENLGEAGYADMLDGQRRHLRDAFRRHEGVEVDTQGDSFFYAFADARQAVAAVTEVQQTLSGPIKVRMGLHTGQPLLTEEGYVGLEVHRAARIAAAAHGGQVLLSGETGRLVEGDLVDLGEHRLKDFREPVRMFQLGSQAFPPLNTISNTNLPRPASSFVGRGREVSEVVALLQRGVRLLTLTGPGGSGKTRLAIEAAAEQISRFKGGVFWLELAAVREPALLFESIAQTLGAKDNLTRHIGERHLLLLLDNLEQVVDAAPELAMLVERCAHLTVIVTSRQLLRVRGEFEYRVTPLATQDAVVLFHERSGVQSDESVAELCRRLDNLPLAVELAAARASVLSPAQILQRLSQRLDLLKGGQDLEARQQTLRATIAWSHGLLTEGEKALYARLSIFAASFSLEAAEVVCGADVDTLQSLLDKSLVHRAESRFAMLETIREHAAEQLGQLAEAEPLIERLGQYLIDLIDGEDPPMFLGRQARVFELLELEHANTRTVLHWALRDKRHPIVLRLVATLFRFWVGRGHSVEARLWAEAALSARETAPLDLQLRMLVGASEILRASGNIALATALKEELVGRAEQCDLSDPLWVPAALVNLADIAMAAGEFPRARRLAEQSLELRLARGLHPARAHAALAELARREGDFGLAEELFDRAARGFVEMQDEVNAAWSFQVLGELALRGGDKGRATDRFRTSLRLSVDLLDMRAVGDRLQDLADAAWSGGDVDKAARLWGAGLRIHRNGSFVPARSSEPGELSELLKAEGAAMSLEDALVLALDAEGERGYLRRRLGA